MTGFAWVTLATNDSYCLGALVLAHSLRRVNTAHQLAILITPGVSQAMRMQLNGVFQLVKEVDVLDSRDEANLRLLARPELGITFTKLHCWTLTQFDKCIFLDADTLVLQNCDELFEREEFSAAPDAGWPDCFNTGVFVYKPSNETFQQLIDFALKHGSFDGGDQGLLNQFFSDWATKDICKHLPFVYNMCSTATYSYLPAFKQFGDQLKIVHFIGASKPWLQPFDAQTGLARVSTDSTNLGTFIQFWWDLFCKHIHPHLSTEMSEQRLRSLNVSPVRASAQVFFPSSVTLPRPVIQPDTCPDQPPVFREPWSELAHTNTVHYLSEHNGISTTSSKDAYSEGSHFVPTNTCTPNFSHSRTSTASFQLNVVDIIKRNYVEKTYPKSSEGIMENIRKKHRRKHNRIARKSDMSNLNTIINRHNGNTHTLEPEYPSSNTHFISNKITDSGLNYCQEIVADVDERTKTPAADSSDAGLAGALSNIRLGSSQEADQIALEEHLRQRGWEEGNIDYMGRDSFDNIWRKICQTLAASPTSPPLVSAETPTLSSAVPLSPPQSAISPVPSIQSDVPPSSPVQSVISPSQPTQSAVPPSPSTPSAVPPSPLIQSAEPSSLPIQTAIPSSPSIKSAAPPSLPILPPVPSSPPIPSAVSFSPPINSDIPLSPPIDSAVPPPPKMQTFEPPPLPVVQSTLLLTSIQSSVPSSQPIESAVAFPLMQSDVIPSTPIQTPITQLQPAVPLPPQTADLPSPHIGTAVTPSQLVESIVPPLVEIATPFSPPVEPAVRSAISPPSFVPSSPPPAAAIPPSPVVVPAQSNVPPSPTVEPPTPPATTSDSPQSELVEPLPISPATPLSTPELTADEVSSPEAAPSSPVVDDTPVPPKRKGGSKGSAQSEASKSQSKGGGKQGKGKK